MKKNPGAKRLLAATEEAPKTKAPTKNDCEKKQKRYERADNKDVVFFRLGYLKYMKLNEENMVQKFEAETWYDIDLIFNWKRNMITIYVNGVLNKKSSVNFFVNTKGNADKNRVESANAISIYGLSPESNSKFAGIRVYNQI